MKVLFLIIAYVEEVWLIYSFSNHEYCNTYIINIVLEPLKLNVC
jgi:hypothetical protein